MEQTPDIQVMARNEAELGPALRQLEFYTPQGLLTMFWHGKPGFDGVVVTGGGAMGSVLGPAGSLYFDLAVALAAQGVATIRVGWRYPNDLALCTADMMAACVIAAEEGGAVTGVTIGHSFGGAIAVRAAIELPRFVRGVITLATQSAGCEAAALLGGRPLLMFHGDQDRILPPDTSEMVRMIAGEGELVVLPGAGHGLGEARDEIYSRCVKWIPEVLASEPPYSLETGEEPLGF